MKCFHGFGSVGAIVFTGLVCSAFAAKDVDYSVELDKFEPFTFTEKEYYDPGTLRLTRKSRNNFVISGDFKFAKNLGFETRMQYELKKLMGGKYERLASGGDVFCRFLEKDKQYWPRIVEKSNMPAEVTCPFPKGDYFMKDFNVGDDFLPRSVPSGNYMVTVTFFVDGEAAFGYSVYTTVTKK